MKIELNNKKGTGRFFFVKDSLQWSDHPINILEEGNAMLGNKMNARVLSTNFVMKQKTLSHYKDGSLIELFF